MKKFTFSKINVVFILLLAGVITNTAKAQSGYVIGDFHQHSTFTDGSWSIGHMMQKNAEFGLDWWANSEHGGAFNRWGLASGKDFGTTVTWAEAGVTLLGDNDGEKMFRWQSLKDWSFPQIELYRKVLANKVIIQGYEMNVPGHEHAGVGIISSQFDSIDATVNPLAEFEYKFDGSDTDSTGGADMGWVKSVKEGHAKTLEAIAWLQANYAEESWLVPAHPERKKKYTIADFRDMNNAGPDVCFGFESMPGHQKSSGRGGYSTSADGGGTYGGCGTYAATIGGLWDAMLSEGRKFWLFASSDFHDVNGDFYPGEYQKTYTYVTDKKDPKAIVNGLRSGNSWVVEGDLIDVLDFSLKSDNVAYMGETVSCEDGYALVEVIIRDPETDNNFGMNPELDHVDVIMGDLTGMVAPTDTNYNTPEASGARIIARFDENGGVTSPNGIESKPWMKVENGKILIYFAIRVVDGCYIRLRGTNQPLALAGETDENGNPVLDFEMGDNDSTKAVNDLWFYSNPIFAVSDKVYDDKSLKSGLQEEDVTSSGIIEDMGDVFVYPNPANDVVYFSNVKANSAIEVYNMSGTLVLNGTTEGNSLNVSSLKSGIYLAKINDGTKMDSVKFVVE
ncbi:T9SS type A sorting domain-containing protein [uncultured Draconibacterium sp.]|uniref:T9SS type A sorting domain-containing protein n=1 Tax=uncultured Draconibacterium sp. TaxID=1573823 RepID=UPI0032173616